MTAKKLSNDSTNIIKLNNHVKITEIEKNKIKVEDDNQEVIKLLVMCKRLHQIINYLRNLTKIEKKKWEVIKRQS